MERGRRTRALTIVTAGALCAVLTLSGGPASADGGAERAGQRVGGPVVEHPNPRPYEYAAGQVCDFPARAEWPEADLTRRLWLDRDGNPVFGLETGRLVLRATNLATGKSVERDVSGTATYVFPDENSFVISGDHWVAGFWSHDEPANRWLVAGPRMTVRISTEGGVKAHGLPLVGDRQLRLVP